jgi:putative photosynthetic complex assembly protein 2
LAIGAAILFALFVWWFATGLVLLLVQRSRRVTALRLAALIAAVATAGLAASGSATGLFGAYLGFSAAILLWGALEVAFLTGAVTGPAPHPCPPGARGLPRFSAAVGALLYHELTLVGGALLTALLVGAAPNRIGLLTYAVLWTMRLSAKLNMFFGVPVLNDSMLPAEISFLRSYFRRARSSIALPLSLGGAALALFSLIEATETAATAAAVGYTLVATLLALAIVEHLFMILPLPVDRLWAWSSQAGRSPKSDDRTSGEGPRAEIERVVPSLP